MTEHNPAACELMLQMGCSYDQAYGMLCGLLHDVVGQMRTINAPNHGKFWAHNSTSSRGSLFVDEAPRERVESKPLDAHQSLKYTPRSTNASMDHMVKARKKDREKVAKIASLEERHASLVTTVDQR